MANKEIIVTNGTLSLQNRSTILSIFVSTTPLTNQVLTVINVVEAFQLPINCVGSICNAQITPTDNFVLRVNKNGVTVITISFEGGDPDAVFANASPITFNINDKLSITAQASVDATIAEIAITLKGVYI